MKNKRAKHKAHQTSQSRKLRLKKIAEKKRRAEILAAQPFTITLTAKRDVKAFDLQVFKGHCLALPLTSAKAGTTYIAKIKGRVSGVKKLKRDAFLCGAPVHVGSDKIARAPASRDDLINAYALANANTGDATMEIDMAIPIAL